jgi:hypothetical protein
MDVAFLSAVVYAIVGGVKEQFPVIQGQWTRLLALALGLLLAFGTEVRLLAEYGTVAGWLDAILTGFVIGLGIPTTFHKAAQAVAVRGTFGTYTSGADIEV